MDLGRMLQKCHKHQWEVGDLDWSRPARAMSEADERAVVQYFTDMAQIERLAAALFVEQGKRTEDPVLSEIFETFVKDELRHAHAAQMLADHYDVHKFELYQPNGALRRFAPHFVYALQFLSPEFANLYITTGELILDVALLRSIDDFVDDDMSHEAMAKINQDESRHIAIDYHMVEYYSSDDYVRWLASRPPQSIGEQARAWWAFGQVLRHARPFFQEVFFEPMRKVDPTGVRIKEAFKRIQLLASKPRVRERPFSRFLLGLQAVHNHPVGGVLFGRAMVRILGVDSDVLRDLWTQEEYDRAQKMSFDALAAEALQAKFA